MDIPPYFKNYKKEEIKNSVKDNYVKNRGLIKKDERLINLFTFLGVEN